jgi:hypothetical protein
VQEPILGQASPVVMMSASTDNPRPALASAEEQTALCYLARSGDKAAEARLVQ